jgi:hypothetical protein
MSSMTFVINDAATESTNPKIKVTITELAGGMLHIVPAVKSATKSAWRVA